MNKFKNFIINRYNITNSYSEQYMEIETYPKEPVFTLLSDMTTVIMALLITFYL